jgi:hypothetical protein
MRPAKSEEFELLSSGSTTFWKRVFPTAWSLGVGAITVAAWLDLIGHPPAPELVKGALLGGWALFSGFFFRWFGRLRNVWRDGNELVVGDRMRGPRVRLDEVREIKESRFQRLKMVTLKLSRPTPLGSEVTFLPKGTKTFWIPWADSEVVRDLEERRQHLLAGGESGRGHDLRR